MSAGQWEQPDLWGGVSDGQGAAAPPPQTPFAKKVLATNGQAKASPGAYEQQGGNYLLANAGGGDGVAPALHPQQFSAYMGGQV
jgi:hypothetical protein